MKKLVDRLNGLVEQHAQPIRRGARESHDLESLSKRVLAPVDACQEFLARGLLTPVGALTRNGENGPWVFASDDLNDLRKFVLAEVVARVIDESDGGDDEISLAASHALSAHKSAQQDKKPSRKEFSARISRGGAVMLGRYEGEEEKPKLIKAAARAAAVAGVAGAGLYGLGHYATYKTSQRIAAKHGDVLADAYRRNVGIGAKLKAGFGLAKAGTLGAAKGALAGAKAGARPDAVSALLKLRRAAIKA